MTPKIIDKNKIRIILDEYMLRPQYQFAPFLVSIFSREHHKGGITYEGARPISAVTDADGSKTYTISNSDSNYSCGIESLKLEHIEYIQELLP